MRVFPPSKILLILAFLLLGCACSQSQDLIGRWKTDTVQLSPPGYTNTYPIYQLAEFRKDGSFRITPIIKPSVGKEVEMPGRSGVYKLVDTNHLELDLILNPKFPDSKIPMTVFFSISGDELEIPALVADDSPTPTKLKYHRMK